MRAIYQQRRASLIDQLEHASDDPDGRIGTEYIDPDDRIYPVVPTDENGHELFEGLEGVSIRYAAGVEAFLTRSPRNFSTPYVTVGGDFSDRPVAWDPDESVLQVRSPSTGELSSFHVSTDTGAALTTKALEVAEWQRLIMKTESELFAEGYTLQRGEHEVTFVRTSEPRTDEEVDAFERKIYIDRHGDNSRAVDGGFGICQSGNVLRGDVYEGHLSLTEDALALLEEKGIIRLLDIYSHKVGSTLTHHILYASSEGVIEYTVGGQYPEGWSVRAGAGKIAGILWSANSGFDGSYPEKIASMDATPDRHWLAIGGSLYEFTQREGDTLITAAERCVAEQAIVVNGVPPVIRPPEIADGRLAQAVVCAEGLDATSIGSVV